MNFSIRSLGLRLSAKPKSFNLYCLKCAFAVYLAPIHADGPFLVWRASTLITPVAGLLDCCGSAS